MPQVKGIGKQRKPILSKYCFFPIPDASSPTRPFRPTDLDQRSRPLPFSVNEETSVWEAGRDHLLRVTLLSRNLTGVRV